MIELGQYATLNVVKTTDFGVYLDGKQFGEVLLPKRYVPEGLEPGDDMDIFLYCDSEDRVIATTEIPNGIVGECAYMKVVDTADHGAFLDWGLMKDLFVPLREQMEPLVLGKYYVVKLFLDANTDRIFASSKLVKHLSETIEDGDLAVGQEVKLMVWNKTDLGYKMIINDQFVGVVYKNEVFQPLQIGEILRGYVKNIREDKRIDLSLKKQGYEQQIPDASNVVLKKLKENKGYLELTDASAPEAIYEALNMSKKAFKKAVGGLYKQRLITLEKKGIRLV
jgi:uncharacterized protein